ncbi:MAG: arylesterase [Halieaceae bacterium]|nr:arylesterase [Halieaceae bacterium]
MIIERFLYPVLRTAVVAGLLLLWLSLPVQANERRILVLGDSISAAYGMSLEQGWVSLLARQLADTEPPTGVINASISGETTTGGLRRLPDLLSEHAPSLVIIELGANDGLRGYPIKQLRANLQNMVQLSRDSGAEVMLVAMEIPPNYGSRYTADFRDSYTEVARNTGSTLAPFLLDGVATDPALMQPDGIHPAVAAQPLLLQNILPSIHSALARR